MRPDTNHSPLHLTEALAQAHHHWQAQPRTTRTAAQPPFTIAFSRQAGTYGAAIARAVADRLGWPLYDRELLQRIADDMGVHRRLLDSVDERQVGWLGESLDAFFAVPAVSQSAYFRHMVETLFSLAAHGECLIVGRGATNVLPPATTLRVRLVAPLDYRIAAVASEHRISQKEAARRVEKTDEERDDFVMNHFQSSPADPHNYDLVLNVARFSRVECADLILSALACMSNRRDLLAGNCSCAAAGRREPAVVGGE